MVGRWRLEKKSRRLENGGSWHRSRASLMEINFQLVLTSTSPSQHPQDTSFLESGVSAAIKATHLVLDEPASTSVQCHLG